MAKSFGTWLRRYSGEYCQPIKISIAFRQYLRESGRHACEFTTAQQVFDVLNDGSAEPEWLGTWLDKCFEAHTGNGPELQELPWPSPAFAQSRLGKSLYRYAGYKLANPDPKSRASS